MCYICCLISVFRRLCWIIIYIYIDKYWLFGAHGVVFLQNKKIRPKIPNKHEISKIFVKLPHVNFWRMNTCTLQHWILTVSSESWLKQWDKVGKQLIIMRTEEVWMSDPGPPAGLIRVIDARARRGWRRQRGDRDRDGEGKSWRSG